VAALVGTLVLGRSDQIRADEPDASTAAADAGPSPPATARATPTPEHTTPPARHGRPAVLRRLDPLVHREEDGSMLSDLPGDQTVILTLDARLQNAMEAYFDRYEVPYAGLVAIEPSTGRVLAYVSHSSADPNAGDLARDATPPAASVFKIITASALLEAGVGPQTEVCYHGGSGGISLAHLTPDPVHDTACATLSSALGRSLNVVFARLADEHLDPASLGRFASAFGFGETLPFDVPTRESEIDIPSDRLEFARTAAGFWHSHMSPLHGALIASTIANDGRMPRATMVDSLLDAEGHVAYESHPETYRAVIGRRTAHLVREMMQRTVTEGTSRRAFHDDHGRPFLPGTAVAGKTGTLSSERPYRGYTWWVGFAPADAPRIAIGVVVVNTPTWRIKANHAAVEALRQYLVVEHH
jgi:cell division protein FtsI/penicillin-binding protein 2